MELSKYKACICEGSAENAIIEEVKSYDFVKNYFDNPLVLVAVIKKYHEMSRVPKGEYTLLDLLR